MELGNFSVSLAVKDIHTSKEFYEKLGFRVIAGNEKQNWLIMKNNTTNIGLFQGMFEKNILTFNPGWDHNGKEINPFTDIRDIQSVLKGLGIKFETEAAAGIEPSHFVITDPDGNTILVDQHRKKENID